jgi:DNA mismatch repair ATPase MutS
MKHVDQAMLQVNCLSTTMWLYDLVQAYDSSALHCPRVDPHQVSGSDEPVAMELNGAALEGLEVLENALGGTQGSLLGLLDHCTTPFGRRRLRRWLTRPLYRIADITRRQDAVEVGWQAPRQGCWCWLHKCFRLPR